MCNSIGRHRLGALDRQTQSTVPHKRGQHTEGTRHTEQYGVVVHLLQTVVLEQHTGVSIYVRPRVLHLAQLGQDWWHDLVDVRDQPEQRVVWQVLEGELALAGIAGIGLTQHSVTVTGHNLARLERLPDELLHLILASIVTQLLAQLLQPHQHFLVGQTVQRTGKTVHTGGKRQVRIAQRRTDQMDRVGRHVTTLVVTVDRQVQAHQLGELLILVAQHLGEVGRPILLWVDRTNTLAVAVRVTVDGGRNHRQLSDQVHAVLVHVLPVLALVHTVRVRFSEFALVVKGGHGAAQLRHRVKRGGHVVKHGDDVRWQGSTVGPFAGQRIDLSLRRHVTSDQQPEQTLGQWFLTTWNEPTREGEREINTP
uniref:Uncharacterized protein n=1 Tax=Anopheles maculatus TaxID=74869 RepID=A0A182SDY3_9DIPT